jgi:hypothetical protein
MATGAMLTRAILCPKIGNQFHALIVASEKVCAKHD